MVGETDQAQPEVQALTLVDNESEVPPTYGRTMLPAPDETLVRLVHAETEVETVTARSGPETLGPLEFGGAAEYQTVDPDRALRIHGPGRSEGKGRSKSKGKGKSGGVLETITDGLRPGHAYSIYVVEARPNADDSGPTVATTVDAVARPRLRTDER